MLPFVPLLLASASLLRVQEGATNLLKNGGFEQGGRSLASWQEIYPTSLATSEPEFASTEWQPHDGTRAASIAVKYEGGYTSLTQSLRVPKGARAIHFECWARIDEPSARGGASMMVWFSVPTDPNGGSAAQSQRLTDQREWTRLTVDAAIPEGTQELLVRCGVFGPCRASFDEARVTCSTTESVSVKLAVAHGDYTAVATGTSAEPWLRVSIPFPLGGQTPLAVRVTSEPPDAVAALALHAERENRPLEVRLRELAPGAEVRLRAETLALLRDRPLTNGKGVALGKGKAPKEVKQHLAAAPGIDAEAKEVRAAAKALPDDDLAALMEGLCAFLRAKLEYAGGEDQGALHCLASGKAVCTGYANTAAALLIARGVPARVLACATIGARLQEHYVVEAWTPAGGWSRIESTAAAFPWGDAQNLVLRVVYPDSPRSAANVPLYKDASPGLECRYRLGTDSCWQGGEELRTFTLGAKTLAALEERTRAAFERWTENPAGGATRIFPESPPAAEREIFAAVEEWLARPGRLGD